MMIHFKALSTFREIKNECEINIYLFFFNKQKDFTANQAKNVYH